MMKWSSLMGMSRILGLVALTLGLVEPAHARNIPPVYGHSWPNADENCFEHSWTIMTNVCSTTKKLVIGVPLERGETGTFIVYVKVFGSGNPNQRVQCGAVSQDFSRDGEPSHQDSKIDTTSGNQDTWQSLESSIFQFTPYSNLQVECDIDPGRKIGLVMLAPYSAVDILFPPH